MFYNYVKILNLMTLRRELFITVALSILSYYCGEQKLVGWILKKLA